MKYALKVCWALNNNSAVVKWIPRTSFVQMVAHPDVIGAHVSNNPCLDRKILCSNVSHALCLRMLLHIENRNHKQVTIHELTIIYLDMTYSL